jgi:hypothetical protein
VSNNHDLAVELRKLADLIEGTDHNVRVDFYSHPRSVKSQNEVLRMFDGLVFESKTNGELVWLKSYVLGDDKLHVTLFPSREESMVTA